MEDLRAILSAPAGKSEPPAKEFDPDALTRALRVAGAALVVASASTFMLQHWQTGNDLARYAMLVGQSLLLAGAAYFVGLSLREGRSARTFLALLLLTMPVSFAVLGGLVYSQFHVEGLSPLPSYATWVAPSKLSALLAVLVTLAVLAPLAVVSFVALLRKEAKILTLTFLAGNLLLVVPVREPLSVLILAGIWLLVLLRFELARFRGSAQLATVEGRLARVMPIAPPIITLGRVFHLYHPGPAFVGGVLLLASAAFWSALSLTHSAEKRDTGAACSVALSVLGWMLCWFEMSRALGSVAHSALLLGLPLSLLVLLGSLRARQWRATFRGVAAGIAELTALVACGAELDTVSALTCVAVGVTIGVWGASVRARFRTVSGALVALFGLGVQVWLAIHADNLLRWASLSLLGIGLIVGSAYLEQNRAKVARWWQARRLSRPLEETP